MLSSAGAHAAIGWMLFATAQRFSPTALSVLALPSLFFIQAIMSLALKSAAERFSLPGIQPWRNGASFFQP